MKIELTATADSLNEVKDLIQKRIKDYCELALSHGNHLQELSVVYSLRQTQHVGEEEAVQALDMDYFAIDSADKIHDYILERLSNPASTAEAFVASAELKFG